MSTGTYKRRDDQSLLLDSRLITATIYNLKVVDCGEYSQVYVYNSKRRLTKNDDSDFSLKKIEVNKILDKLSNESVGKKESQAKSEISQQNIIRSKLSCQRLAKANISDWCTFITLTFSDNVTDISYANHRFKDFIWKVRRVKPDLKYLCIPEFQKRGAVHYHVLTNISMDDKIIYSQADNPRYKHVKYWNDGFTSVEAIKGDPKKIIGYISKYMTKDIDNRLFSHRRYLYSQNLKQPKVNYVDLDSKIGLDFYKKIIQGKSLIYSNYYINSYDNSEVTFLEYRTDT